MESLGASFTYSVADIAQPDKRKADFSKTVVLPLSKEARKVFNHLFEINIDSTYNPNLKADALYLVDSETVFDGVIQVKKIISNDDDLLTIEVNLTGKLKNIILEFGDKELDDAGMNWSDMDHTYDRATQQTSWTPTLGVDYVYPMIYYGRHTNLTDFDVEDFFPAVFAKEYVDRMFSDAGFEYTSTFFDSTFFKSLIVPFNGAGEFGLSDANVLTRQYEVDTIEFQATGLTTKTISQSVTAGNGDKILFTNAVVDPSTQYDLVTGTATVAQTGYYDISTALDLTATFNPTGATNDTYANCFVLGKIRIVVNGNFINATNFIITRDQLVGTGGETTTGTTYPDTDYFDFPGFLELDYTTIPEKYHTLTAGQFSAGMVARQHQPPSLHQNNATNILLQAGDTIEVYLNTQNRRINNFDGAGVAWGAGNGYFIDSVDTSWETGHDGQIVINLASGSFMKLKLVNTSIVDGNTLPMADAIPKKVKQKDFFMGLVKMFNLYIEPDPDNSRKLIIEPRVDFLNNTVNNWSEKLDISQDLEFHPMGALDAKNYLWTYKADKDYYNDKYTKAWDAVYGERDYEIVNDFISNEKKLEILFSPTPSVGRTTQDYVIPHIIAVDNQNQAKPVESNIRLLYWGGLKNTATPWNHTSLGTDDFQTQYPYAGHFDDPFTPTVDLNFGLVREIYYDDTFNDITITNNNLFNIYHRDFVDEITNKDSKIVKGWFYLTPSDIRKLSFRELYYFEGAYHRLNKVENYTPTDVRLTRCEFLKLATVTPWVKIDQALVGGKGEPIDDEIIPVKSGSIQENGNNYDSAKAGIQGEDNFVDKSSENVTIQGDRNKVGADSYNINLINSNDNLIDSGLSNVTLINTNGITVEDSNVVYINGMALSGPDVVQQKNGNFVTETKVTTYEVDTSAFTLKADLNSSEVPEGKIYNFKKKSNKNKLIILPGTGYTIDHGPSLIFKSKQANFSLQFDKDSSNWIII